MYPRVWEFSAGDGHWESWERLLQRCYRERQTQISLWFDHGIISRYLLGGKNKQVQTRKKSMYIYITPGHLELKWSKIDQGLSHDIAKFFFPTGTPYERNTCNSPKTFQTWQSAWALTFSQTFRKGSITHCSAQHKSLAPPTHWSISPSERALVPTRHPCPSLSLPAHDDDSLSGHSGGRDTFFSPVALTARVWHRLRAHSQCFVTVHVSGVGYVHTHNVL